MTIFLIFEWNEHNIERWEDVCHFSDRFPFVTQTFVHSPLFSFLRTLKSRCYSERRPMDRIFFSFRFLIAFLLRVCLSILCFRVHWWAILWLQRTIDWYFLHFAFTNAINLLRSERFSYFFSPATNILMSNNIEYHEQRRAESHGNGALPYDIFVGGAKYGQQRAREHQFKSKATHLGLEIFGARPCFNCSSIQAHRSPTESPFSRVQGKQRWPGDAWMELALFRRKLRTRKLCNCFSAAFRVLFPS